MADAERLETATFHVKHAAGGEIALIPESHLPPLVASWTETVSDIGLTPGAPSSHPPSLKPQTSGHWTPEDRPTATGVRVVQRLRYSRRSARDVSRETAPVPAVVSSAPLSGHRRSSGVSLPVSGRELNEHERHAHNVSRAVLPKGPMCVAIGGTPSGRPRCFT